MDDSARRPPSVIIRCDRCGGEQWEYQRKDNTQRCVQCGKGRCAFLFGKEVREKQEYYSIAHAIKTAADNDR